VERAIGASLADLDGQRCEARVVEIVPTSVQSAVQSAVQTSAAPVFLQALIPESPELEAGEEAAAAEGTADVTFDLVCNASGASAEQPLLNLLTRPDARAAASALACSIEFGVGELEAPRPPEPEPDPEPEPEPEPER